MIESPTWPYLMGHNDTHLQTKIVATCYFFWMDGWTDGLMDDCKNFTDNEHSNISTLSSVQET